MKFVRGMLINTMKFPEFEEVTLEALIWKNLIRRFDINDICLMSNVIGSDRKGICERNVA